MRSTQKRFVLAHTPCVRGTGKLKAAICHLQVLETWWLQGPSTRRCAVTHPAPVLQPPPRDKHLEKCMEGGRSCRAAATSAFRGEAAHKARGRHPSQVRFPFSRPHWVGHTVLGHMVGSQRGPVTPHINLATCIRWWHLRRGQERAGGQLLGVTACAQC